MTNIVSVIPNLHSEAGHDLEYNLSVGRSAALLGWEHAAIVPAEVRIANLPPMWEKCLHPPDPSLKGLARLKADWAYVSSLRAYLNRQTKGWAGQSWLFIESFKKSHLLGLYLALQMTPADRRPGLMLFYRYAPEQYGSAVTIYRWLNNRFAAVTGGRCALLTDSELLAASLSSYFDEEVTVMPVPHIPPPSNAPAHDGDVIRCWWPGPPRPQKGLELLKKICATPQEGAERIAVYAAATAGLEQTGGAPRVHPVDHPLPREEYDRMLAQSDVILMPYKPEEYRQGTSGIFIECVAAGKLPLVTGGTWMSYELERFNLPELAIDWQPETFAADLQRLVNDPNVRKKLEAMQKAYRTFHNEEGYAEKLKAVTGA